MNAARLHDKHKLKRFWEKKIEEEEEEMEEEEKRRRRSALQRLRQLWTLRLDQRNRHQQSFYEERIRRAEKTQQNLKNLDST